MYVSILIYSIIAHQSTVYANSLLTMYVCSFCAPLYVHPYFARLYRLNTRGFAARVDTYGVERGDIQLEFGSIPSVNSSANPGTDLQPAFPPLILTASRAAEKVSGKSASFIGPRPLINLHVAHRPIQLDSGRINRGVKAKVTQSHHDIEFSRYV